MTRRLFLFLTLTGLAAGICFGNPDAADASKQSCNPTIQSASAFSQVNGVTKTFNAGPGVDLSSPPNSTLEEATVASSVDVTSGMTYRGNGEWRDNLGNVMRLNII